MVAYGRDAIIVSFMVWSQWTRARDTVGWPADILFTWTRRDAVYSLLYTDNSSGKRACCAFTKFLPKGQLIMVERAVHSLNSYRKVS